LILAAVSPELAVIRKWPRLGAAIFDSTRSQGGLQILSRQGQVESVVDTKATFDSEAVQAELRRQIAAVDTVIVGDGVESFLEGRDVRQHLPGKLVVYDPVLAEAIADFVSLQRIQPQPHRLATALLLPSEADQQTKISAPVRHRNPPAAYLGG